MESNSDPLISQLDDLSLEPLPLPPRISSDGDGTPSNSLSVPTDPISIRQLPPELINRILEIGAGPYWLYPRERKAFLSSTSLVCQEWADASQRVLMRAVNIKEEGQARRFLESPLIERWVCRELTLSGEYYGESYDSRSGVGTGTLRAILLKVKGVRSLDLSLCGISNPLCITALCGEGMRELTSLYLRNFIITNTKPFSIPNFPFSLTSFDASGYGAKNFPTPFTVFSSGKIESFSMDFVPQRSQPPSLVPNPVDLANFIFANSETLLFVELVGPVPSELLPAISSCSELCVLDVELTGSQFKSLVCNLRACSLCFRVRFNVVRETIPSIVSVLDRVRGVLCYLELYDDETAFMERPGALELVKELVLRDVSLSFRERDDDDYSYLW